MTVKDEAKELQDYFLGTYAEKVLQSAIDSGSDDLMQLAVKEYGSAKQLIEEQISASSN